jgi:hypothetical protein
MMFRVNAPFWFGHWCGGLIFRRERQEYVGWVSRSFMDECGPPSSIFEVLGDN